jgi:hypothetical protein
MRTLGIIDMNPYVLGWSPVLFGTIQVIIFGLAYGVMWKFLRKKAPVLLGNRGMPIFITAALFGIALPAAIFIALLSHFSGAFGSYL